MHLNLINTINSCHNRWLWPSRDKVYHFRKQIKQKTLLFLRHRFDNKSSVLSKEEKTSTASSFSAFISLICFENLISIIVRMQWFDYWRLINIIHRSYITKHCRSIWSHLNLSFNLLKLCLWIFIILIVLWILSLHLPLYLINGAV